jgi:predicted enzyme related to lactoylglutathione lyase
MKTKNKNMRKKAPEKFKVLFVAGFGPIVQDASKSHRFYADALGISFQREGDYLHTQKLDGVKHFALWSLAQAAQSCFGSTKWPSGFPVPQAWLEFDVDDIEKASTELQERGYTLLTKARKEPWGQIVTRLLSPEGILVAVTITPAMRE